MSAVDAVFAQAFGNAKKKLGDSLVLGSETPDIMVGIPFPSLLLEYLYYTTGFPLQRITTLVGKTQSCKTAFGFEIMRWHHTHGGGSGYIDAENKNAAVVRDGTFGWNPIFCSRAMTKQALSIEQSQQCVSAMFKGVTDAAIKHNIPGQIAMAVLVDSLMGNVPLKEKESLEENDGASSKGHPISALQISRWSRYIQNLLDQQPYSLLITNHLRHGTDNQGRPTRSVPGGTSVPFFTSVELEFSLLADLGGVDRGGKTIRIKMHKNCVGPDKRSIDVDFIWWWEPIIDAETGSPVVDQYGVPIKQQHFAWDWDAGTLRLLKRMASNEATKFKAICANACDFNFVGTNERGANARVWSRTLGIPEKKPVSYRHAGAELQNRPDLMSAMRAELNISYMREFQPGMEFRKQLMEAEEAARIRVSSSSPRAVQVLPDTSQLVEQVAAEQTIRPLPPAQPQTVAPQAVVGEFEDTTADFG